MARTERKHREQFGHGKKSAALCLPGLWLGRRQMGRALRQLRRMECHGRGDRGRAAVRQGAALPKGKAGRLVPLKGDEPPLQRIESGIAELDRVTGGGLVPGSAVLIGGDPGIGKSTLLMQALAALARAGRRRLYLRRGGGRADQAPRRAARPCDAPVMLAAETTVRHARHPGRRPPAGGRR